MHFLILFNEEQEKEMEDCSGARRDGGNCRPVVPPAVPKLPQSDYRWHFLSQKMNFIDTSYSYLNTDGAGLTEEATSE